VVANLPAQQGGREGGEVRWVAADASWGGKRARWLEDADSSEGVSGGARHALRNGQHTRESARRCQKDECRQQCKAASNRQSILPCSLTCPRTFFSTVMAARADEVWLNTFFTASAAQRAVTRQGTGVIS
jgi:hypothetical protein